jgi:SAM-dependent methyltransferase
MSLAVATDRVMPDRPCPICASSRAERLQRMRFALPDAHPLTDRYDVVCCERCGFVYADTRSTQADYDSYYADLSKYSDAATATGAGAQGWDRARLVDTATSLAARLGDPDALVVDVGCANGGLLSALGELGYRRLFGVDPSPACVQAAAALPGVSAATGTLFALPTGARGADCVVLSHVLEHVRDVRRALRTVHETLAPNGVVYVEVPDATRYAECLVAPFQDFNVEDINHFSAPSLTNALATNGFVVESTTPKTIEAAAGVPYPAVAAIASKSETVAQQIVPDEALRSSMSTYIDRSREQIADLDRNLHAALAGTPEVIIWGTGQTTLTLLSHTNLGGARAVALTDSNRRYHGLRIGGIPVVPPSDLFSMDAPILIGTLINDAAIQERILEMGLPNRVVHLSVH